jgi:putative transposase
MNLAARRLSRRWQATWWRGAPPSTTFRTAHQIRGLGSAETIGRPGTVRLDIRPGNSWENWSCECFNGKVQDECLNGEVFYSLKEAQVVIDLWRVEYNTRRPHPAFGYRPPVLAACSPLLTAKPISQPGAVM